MAYVSNNQQPAAGVSAGPKTTTAKPTHGQRPAQDPAIAARKQLLEQRLGMALRELDARVYQGFRNAIFSYDQVVGGTHREREALAAIDPKNPTLLKYDRLLKDIDDLIGRWWSS